MKLEGTFYKTSEGKIRASLTVMDAEDYRSTFIFMDETDWPSRPLFNLRTKDNGSNYIDGEFDTGDEATAWVEEQVRELKDTLNDWREVVVPKKMEYTI